jgi:hypothetical protein
MKKIDIQIQPKESIKIPSILSYKEWEIKITKNTNGYTLMGYRNSESSAGKMYLDSDLRKHLSNFKKMIDKIL